MTITHKLKMDLTQKGPLLRIPVVQGDTFSRKLSVSLYADRRPWQVPDGATALIRYRTPNGETGIYDTLPDGTAAAKIFGNCVSILIAPEAVSLAGTTVLMVTILTATRQLTTFTMELQVHAICGADETDPQATAWISALLPAPGSAAAGQYLVVETVSDEGRVLSLQAVDSPTCDEEDIRSIVEACLAESAPVSLSHSWDGTVLTVTSAAGTSSADLQGEKGEQGEQGEQGEPGPAGADGITPHIGSNGNWWLGSTDTGVAAGGSDATVTVDTALDAASENPVQNKVITQALNETAARLLPAVTTEDDGKFLQVVSGSWSAVSISNAEEVTF